MSALRIPARGLRASATPYFNPLVAGAYTGYQKLRNPTALTLEPNVENEAIRGTEKENYGQTLDALLAPGDFNFGMTMNRTDANNLSIAMLGSTADIDVAAAVGVTADIPAFNSRYAVLGHRNVSNVTIPGLVEDTDFRIADANSGIIEFLDTVAVPDGVVTATFDHGLYQGDQVDLFTNTVIKGALFVDAIDQVSGKEFELELYQVSLSNDGGIDILNSDRVEIQLAGLIETPDGQTQPGRFRFIN